MNLDPEDNPEGEERDGRRKRSAASKLKIIEAMLDLIRAGELAPSADMVADKAGVGRRTVFRLFNDMESIYSEMHALMRRMIAPIRAIPLKGDTPAERLSALIDRRTRLFEEILPVVAAAAVHRPRSTFLKADHAGISSELRSLLAENLPAAVRDDPARFEALDAILSIEMWRRLREDQKLAPGVATILLKRLALPLLED